MIFRSAPAFLVTMTICAGAALAAPSPAPASHTYHFTASSQKTAIDCTKVLVFANGKPLAATLVHGPTNRQCAGAVTSIRPLKPTALSARFGGQKLFLSQIGNGPMFGGMFLTPASTLIMPRPSVGTPIPLNQHR